MRMMKMRVFGILTALLFLMVPVAVASADCNCPGLWTVDIGDEGSESLVSMDGWGPIEPGTAGGTGSYGGVDDCRVVWEPEGDPCAEITITCCDCARPVALEWSALDGVAADDSYEVWVDGELVFTYDDTTPPEAEIWVPQSINLESLGLPNSHTHTIEFCAIGEAWSYQGTYGQVAIDWIDLETEPCDGNADVDLDIVILEPECICINVNPACLDFGSAYPGSTTTLTNALVISNCGDVDVWVEVEAGPVGTLFYDELELDSGLGWYFWEDWGTTILAGSNKSVDAQLYIPSGTLPGADSGTLNFWATEAI